MDGNSEAEMAFRTWPSMGQRGPRVGEPEIARKVAKAREVAIRASLARKVEPTAQEVAIALARIGRGGIPSRTVVARSRRRRDPDALVDPQAVCVEGVAWTVARVVSGQERDIAEDLAAQGFRTYCPLMRVLTQPRLADGRRPRKVRQRPVFVGYLFVGAPAGRVVARALHEGIVDVLGDVEQRRDSRVVKALAALISAINRREMSGELDEVKRGKTRPEPRFDVGDVVRVTDGPFALFFGVVDSLIYDRVTIDLQIFGRSTPATLDVSQLEPA